MAAGLLVKLGAVPLHLWLPLAHAAAPAPASAVLSGAMLKAGLFGLMTVLPLGGIAAPEAAAALAAMALAGLILAPALGLAQGDAKAVLAYSSIGQMSLMALGLAAALAAPGAWPVIAPALVLLAAHHAFAKAALFLGVPAVWASSGRLLRGAVIAALALPALALAGLPGTSGWIAKDALKAALAGASGGWQIWLGAALFVSSLGTALLMLRAGALLVRTEPKPNVAKGYCLALARNDGPRSCGSLGGADRIHRAQAGNLGRSRAACHGGPARVPLDHRHARGRTAPCGDAAGGTPCAVAADPGARAQSLRCRPHNGEGTPSSCDAAHDRSRGPSGALLRS